MALIITSTAQYEADAPITGLKGKFNRLETPESTASTACPEYDDLSDIYDSDDDFSVEIEATMKTVRYSIARFNAALKLTIPSDDDFEAKIEAEILEATTRKTTCFLPTEEQVSFEASIGMWDDLAATRNAGCCEARCCRCSVSCFAPPPEVCTVSSTKTDDSKVERGIDFWAREAFIFTFGLCLFAFFASIGIQSTLTKFLLKFCVSLTVLCISSPCSCSRTWLPLYFISAAISILACLGVALRPQMISV